MPKLTVENVGEFEVPQGKRLVLALEDDAKVDQLHACGGNARCTTCRVEFVAGEPDTVTVAEKTVLAALTGWGQQEDRRRIAGAGFDHHLVKPLEAKALEGLLAALKPLTR